MVVRVWGRGGFTYDDDDGYQDEKNQDLTPQDSAPSDRGQFLHAPGSNGWHIEPGSGHGDLVGITGSGTLHFQDGELTPGGMTGDPNSSYGHMDGTVTCRVANKPSGP